MLIFTFVVILPSSDTLFSSPLVSAGSETDGDVIDLKLTAKLGAFNVLVCDENCDIADIRIRGKFM